MSSFCICSVLIGFYIFMISISEGLVGLAFIGQTWSMVGRFEILSISMKCFYESKAFF